MAATMLIELWERLRGYDKWVQTEAKIESSDVEKTPVTDRYGRVVDYAYNAGDVITWVDNRGENQYATFDVAEGSKLYQLVDGDSVTIRYDPAQPDRFYYRDLLRYRVKVTVRATVILLAVAALYIAIFWARLH
jgi:hypothetical protein